MWQNKHSVSVQPEAGNQNKTSHSPVVTASKSSLRALTPDVEGLLLLCPQGGPRAVWGAGHGPPCTAAQGVGELHFLTQSQVTSIWGHRHQEHSQSPIRVLVETDRLMLKCVWKRKGPPMGQRLGKRAKQSSEDSCQASRSTGTEAVPWVGRAGARLHH